MILFSYLFYFFCVNFNFLILTDDFHFETLCERFLFLIGKIFAFCRDDAETLHKLTRIETGTYLSDMLCKVFVWVVFVNISHVGLKVFNSLIVYNFRVNFDFIFINASNLYVEFLHNLTVLLNHRIKYLYILHNLQLVQIEIK